MITPPNRVGLRVLRLDLKAKLPVCAHPGEDLAYDIFALEDEMLYANRVVRVRTGIAVELPGFGFLVRDRSSMALANVTVSGGVIDSGYRGELFANLTYHDSFEHGTYCIRAGDKIAQLIPIAPATHYPPFEVDELSQATRGENGYGSTGR